MARNVFEILTEQIEAEINSKETALGNGSAKDFAEYSHTCGALRGLRSALKYVKDLERKQYTEDEDD